LYLDGESCVVMTPQEKRRTHVLYTSIKPWIVVSCRRPARQTSNTKP
jgi:hypothetical protein